MGVLARNILRMTTMIIMIRKMRLIIMVMVLIIKYDFSGASDAGSTRYQSFIDYTMFIIIIMLLLMVMKKMLLLMKMMNMQD